LPALPETLVVSTAAVSYIDNGLVNGVTYYYWIVSVDQNNNETYTGPVSTYPHPAPPPVPGGFSGMVLSTSTVLWNWNLTLDTSGYYVYSSASLPDEGVSSVSGLLQATYWFEQDLIPNTTYSRKVTAFNAIGEGTASQTDSAVTLANPPSQFQIVSYSSVTASLSWNASGNPAGTRYGAGYSEDNFISDISTFSNYSSNLTQILVTVNFLSPETTYWFRVWAWNHEGIITVSVSDGPILTPAAPPSIPQNVSGLPLSTTTIKWNWSDSQGEDGYYVYDYRLIKMTSSPLSAGTTYWLQDSLLPNTSSQVYVVAFNEVALSTSSISSVVYTYEEPPASSSSEAETSVNSITIYWQGKAGTKYRIEKNGVFIATAPASGISDYSYTDTTSVAAGTQYTYYIYSINDGGSYDSLSRITIIASTPSIADESKPKRKFLDFQNPLEFGTAIEEAAIFDSRGKKILSITEKISGKIVWYGTDDNSQAGSSSDMVESGAYIYKARTVEGKTVYGTVVIVK
ncbi:MAG TPA: fibronectin type III domain-containing protein, partial [bacterium]|nr:fibronectin type III domain-containing protein [bacterium]